MSDAQNHLGEARAGPLLLLGPGQVSVDVLGAVVPVARPPAGVGFRADTWDAEPGAVFVPVAGTRPCRPAEVFVIGLIVKINALLERDMGGGRLRRGLLIGLSHSGASVTETLRSALSLNNPYSPRVDETTESQAALLETLLLLAFTLALPLLIALVLSIGSRVKRVPVSVGLLNGFRAIMPPLVFGLMLVYGGLTLWAVRQEARANYGLERSLHGEGQYLAEGTGQAWPVK